MDDLNKPSDRSIIERVLSLGNGKANGTGRGIRLTAGAGINIIGAVVLLQNGARCLGFAL